MINIEKCNKFDIITFTSDKINALNADDLKAEISKLYDNANAMVIIDLKGVKYIDSTGFGCFLSVLRTAKNNYGILKFAVPEPAVMKVFETLNLHTVLDIYNSVEECIRSIN